MLESSLEWSGKNLEFHDPERAENLPKVTEDIAWIWKAFHRLDLDRGWIGGGMAAPIPRRIPWQSIVDWAGYHGYSREDCEMLDVCISAMDTVYLAHHAKRQR